MGEQVQYIGVNFAVNCSSLKSFILRKTDKPASLAQVAAFRGSAIESGTGYVYVPDELVESYKSATNWATYADQIKPISELEEESE